MTRETATTTRETAAAMRDTAASLEDTEAVLHRSAEESPDPVTRQRLHRLGDAVTAQAENIAGRAHRLQHDGRADT